MSIVLDTNLLIRVITADHPVHSPLARSLLEHSTVPLLVAPPTTSEVVFVLRGAHYRYRRAEIVAALTNLLATQALRFLDADVVHRALALYRDHHTDWGDCMVAAYALEHAGGAVASFDRGLDRIPGITRVDLAAAGA